MNDIKIIKRKTSDGAQKNERSVAVQKQISNPVEIQREMTTVVSGWITDWRGWKQTDARTAFNDLFEISGISRDNFLQLRDKKEKKQPPPRG